MTANAKARRDALIEAHATELKLPTLKRRFRALAQEAVREQQTPVAYLAALLEAEHQERAERRERRRLIDARFPAIQRLEEFQFADNPRSRRPRSPRWPKAPESPLAGRTHLATTLAVGACQQGRRVRFTTLAALANELQEAESRRELARVVGRYARTELVVLDELGYLALPDGAAELVFQVLSERHERGSGSSPPTCPSANGPRSFPTPAWLRPSLTGSPTARTSSTPAPTPPRAHRASRASESRIAVWMVSGSMRQSSHDGALLGSSKDNASA